VVKQALAELNVKELWLADPRRAVTEAAALQLAHELRPMNVPVVIDSDGLDCVITMSAAPREMRNWRALLLGSAQTPAELASVARELGRALGTWHRATWNDLEVAERFSDHEMFDELRITPFHRAVRGKHPDLEFALSVCIEELSSKRECLVHGDFSPKNILVSARQVWVLDFEVAHVGAALFDVAFLAHHLALKAIILPERAADLERCFGQFLATYAETLGLPMDHRTLGWHTAALMLARVDGVSPAGYLSDQQRNTVRNTARASLRTSDSSSGALWATILSKAKKETS